MKKWLIPLIVVIAIVAGSYKWGVEVNNTAVELEANAKTAWSNVESEYQRRNDLIGNLVKIVKGAADFERKTLTDVIEARAKATQTQVNVDDLTPENLAKFQEAQSGLSSALSRLLVTVERYPELKANQNFLKFMDERTSTANSVRTARKRYNEAVNEYDIYTTKFPNKILASMFGFKEMARYKADPGSEKSPEINLDFN
jgi:LemA protein